jgi:hypothetical protein
VQSTDSFKVTATSSTVAENGKVKVSVLLVLCTVLAPLETELQKGNCHVCTSTAAVDGMSVHAAQAYGEGAKTAEEHRSLLCTSVDRDSHGL